MAEIKPAEISAILRKQVEGFESGATLEEVGSTKLEMVLLVFTGFQCSIRRVSRICGLEAMLNLEEDNVGVVLLGPSTGIKEVLCKKNTTYCFS
jgi:F-type H+-transporting ATPase subunit alpha